MVSSSGSDRIGLRVGILTFRSRFQRLAAAGLLLALPAILGAGANTWTGSRPYGVLGRGELLLFHLENTLDSKHVFHP
jgi:hypothetical protein